VLVGDLFHRTDVLLVAEGIRRESAGAAMTSCITGALRAGARQTLADRLRVETRGGF
jgi:hypothetical protein